jgi:ribosomal protein S18 acetylase RimI-like enzyme
VKTHTISVATLEDAPALVALRTAIANDMTRRFGEGDWSAAPSEALVVKQLRASRVLVARREGQLVGTVRLTTAQQWAIDASCFSPAKTAVYVLGLAVAPEARGQGLGQQLMQAAKDSAASWPADAVWLDAYDDKAGAGGFYIRCGFREVGRTSFGQIPLIYYEWQLNGPAARPL